MRMSVFPASKKIVRGDRGLDISPRIHRAVTLRIAVEHGRSIR
jgi:hypothetical protein